MSKTAYPTSLKGYVGSFDNDRSDVDAELAENEGNRVNILVDSRGSLATVLSISAAFCNNRDVAMRFVGLNASTLPSNSARRRWLRTMMDPPLQWNNEGFMSEEDFYNIRSNM
ncbi:MAG: hypothetical protein K2L83_06595 [Muribaculaceae bacterium]|nr:hypothetical protein [Muribaculaceae bacterium]